MQETSTPKKGSIPVSRVIAKLDACFEKNDLSSAERLLAYWQKEAVSLGDISGELSIVNELLGLCRKTADKKGGEAAIARALELLELTDGTDTVSGATVLLNAATTSKAFGHPEKAVLLYEKASGVYERALPADDLRHAALWNNYATALVDLARYDEAENLYMKAIALTKSQPKGLLDAAVTYVNMAHLYEKSEGIDSPRIESCLFSAQELLENSSIVRDGYYAFVAEKCAPSFDYFGYFLFAKTLYRRAKDIYERP